jgi:hypothetical protein
MDIEAIRERVERGDYFVLSHASLHALKEGFTPRDMAQAVLAGKIIEDYPAAQRVLVCGRVELIKNVSVYLHVVCEYADPISVEFVTAYLPDERQWESPPSARRRKGKK